MSTATVPFIGTSVTLRGSVGQGSTERRISAQRSGVSEDVLGGECRSQHATLTKPVMAPPDHCDQLVTEERRDGYASRTRAAYD